MVREKVAIVVLAALLGSAVEAQVVKVHSWPHELVPQPLQANEIPVRIDMGLLSQCLIHIPGPVKLKQVNFRTYTGCLDLEVLCNSSLTLHCTITPTGAVGGEYSAYFANPHVDPPGGFARLCVELTEMESPGPAGQKDVTVAFVKLRVTPR